MAAALLVYSALLLHPAMATTSCPPQCLCSDGNIVCTCESTASSELSVNSLGGSFARSFVVHSCTRVTVQNGSFTGVLLQDKLIFMAIGRLIIEPGAFKGILQSPKQVVFEQVAIPRLLPGSFDGLSRLQHIWFKKSSLDAIETGAFQGVGPLDYLYFRETTMGYLQEQAFGGMRHVRHFFFRGGVRVASSEPKIFANSSIGELVMNDVVGHLHEAVLLDLEAPVLIHNSSLHFTSRGETVPVSTATSESLTISDSRIVSFSPQLNHHFTKITVQSSKINKIKAPDTQLLNYLPAALRLYVEESEIGSFEPLSLAHTKVAELRIRDSRIGTWNQSAFASSKISKITLEDSRIGEIQAGSFADARLEKMTILGGKVVKIAAKALERSTIRRLELKRLEIRHLGEASFGGEIHNLTVEDSRLPVGENRPFKGSKTSHTSFHRCDFQGTMRRAFLDGLSPVRLSLTASRFACDSRDCELNAMLFAPIREDVLWKFEQNSCDSNATLETVCSEPTVTDNGSLRCQRTALIADCVCTASSARLPAIDVQLLVVGDCDELIVDDEHATSPSVLYLYRISKSEFNHAPRNLRAVNVYHSNLLLRPGFAAGRSLDRFWLDKSRLYLEDGALNHATVGSLRLQHSRLSGLSGFSLEGSTIDQLTINGSRLETAAPLLQRTHRLSLVDSVLGSPDGLAAVKFAHLANNTILCCCERDCSPVSSECRQYFPHVRCLSPSAYRSASPSPSIHLLTFLVPLISKYTCK